MTELPVDVAAFETLAHDRLDPAAWEYLSRGAADNITLRATPKRGSDFACARMCCATCPR
jgi:hypothetical protein